MTKLIHQFIHSPFVKATYAQHLYQKLSYAQVDNKTFQFKYTPDQSVINLHKVVHGGALLTLLDITTTLHILTKSPQKSISISMTSQFLRMASIGEQLEILTKISFLGKQLVFTSAVFKVNKEQVFEGTHIKKLLRQNWF